MGSVKLNCSLSRHTIHLCLGFKGSEPCMLVLLSLS